MKTIDMVGYHRNNIGSKKESKDLRADGFAPCVLYGGKDEVHFYTHMILFRDLVYTPEAAFVNMDIEGKEYRCMLKDVQFHPVSEIIMHADFMLLDEKKPVVMDIPVKFTGAAVGLTKGGKLSQKLRKLKVKALPKDMPDTLEINIETLDLGKSVKVGDVSAKNCTMMMNPNLPIATILVPRALKQ